MNEDGELYEDFSYLIVPETFGHGSFGTRCEVCDETDYGGRIRHLPGCDKVTRMVRTVREGRWEDASPPPLPGSGEEQGDEVRTEEGSEGT